MDKEEAKNKKTEEFNEYIRGFVNFLKGKSLRYHLDNLFIEIASFFNENAWDIKAKKELCDIKLLNQKDNIPIVGWNVFTDKKGYIVAFKNENLGTLKISLNWIKKLDDLTIAQKNELIHFFNDAKQKYDVNWGYRYDADEEELILDNLMVVSNVDEAINKAKDFGGYQIYDLENEKVISVSDYEKENNKKQKT
ncbi:hypothetical protein JXZ92_02790 [Mycoplasma sp. CSL10137]|uniref:hypothetical protein n=1 Tax=unclassified Mycoplasma TaxID=2683645 RepID=UPI00197C4921|nr:MULTISPECIES: hypothetical protein [unclassified Mycoplasma]MBN4083731.1 hypothetical protein [Mycoplasma sp. CSL10137]MBU4693115.1 hypothetical protein [Mycoplasma sp. CSL7491-lung]